jgi:hypothetical protein
MPSIVLLKASDKLRADCICPYEQPNLEDVGFKFKSGFWMAKENRVTLVVIDEESSAKLIVEN